MFYGGLPKNHITVCFMRLLITAMYLTMYVKMITFLHFSCTYALLTYFILTICSKERAVQFSLLTLEAIQ